MLTTNLLTCFLSFTVHCLWFLSLWWDTKQIMGNYGSLSRFKTVRSNRAAIIFQSAPQSPGRTNLNGWDPLRFPNKWHILSPEKICTIIEKALVLPSWVLHIHGAQKKRPFACETKTLNFRDRVRLWSSFSQGGGRLCRIKYKRLSCMRTLSAGIWEWTLFNRECFSFVWSRFNSLIGEPCVFGKEF